MQRFNLEGVWTRTKWPRWSFVAGLLLGVILGWIFHGVISFVIRFFFVLVLLVPLIVVLIAYWRLRRRGDRAETLAGPGVSVITFDDAARAARRPEPQPEPFDFSDLDDAPGRRRT